MNTRGFTIVEVMTGMMMFTTGILGMMGTGALVTRMVAGGQRSAMAGVYANGRIEELRATACQGRVAGSELFHRGGTAVARNDWTWITAGPDLYRLTLVTTYKTTQGRQRSETVEATVTCVR